MRSFPVTPRSLAAPPSVRALVLCAGLALLAGPLAAYTVVLKDGSSIQAKEKYKLSGDRAIIVLPNGTQTFVDAKQIDVRKTEEANKLDYGSAVVLDSGTREVAPQQQPPRQKTLADLIKTQSAAPRDLPGARREAREEGVLGRTKAGFVDLSTVTRSPFRELEVASVVQQFFRSQGVEEVEIYQGTEADRPLVEMSTNSEGAVFRALTVAANALLHVRATHPRIAAFELLMTTPERERAGQFVLTADMASGLVSKNVEVSAFFLENVQF